ncbi:acid stress response protein YqgB [Enterobacter kobei]|uniref:acid stress response protein YqgB n=1 Tax=Enterobacter kobei TaxID=208224 RepID=UPI0037096A15
MNKKPVAQSACQQSLLDTPPVYGLLSLCYAAIVVNCFISFVFHAAGALAFLAHPSHVLQVRSWGFAALLPSCNMKSIGYTLFIQEVEVRYV